MSTTELVIASYMGPRQRSCPEAIADPSWYLKQQLRSLTELDHKLDQITVVSNMAGAPAEAYLDTLPEKIRDTPVRVIRRDNTGMSYAAFLTAVQLSDHDILILTEDDYLLTLDHVEERLSVSPFWMTCAASWKWGWRSNGPWGGPTPEQPVATIFVVAATRSVLSKALSRGWFGKPAVSLDPGYDAGCRNQISFSQAVFQTGVRLLDWLHDFGAAYWDGEKIRWYHRQPKPGPWSECWPSSTDPTARAMVIPLQAAGKRVRIQLLEPPVSESVVPPAPSRDFEATLNWDGTLTE